MNQDQDKQYHWANIGEKGSMLGMWILLQAYRVGGNLLFRICLFPVVLCYLALHPVARQASHQYRHIMHACNPAFPAPRFWHGFTHLWSFANTLLDKFAVWMGRITLRDVDVHNGDIIDDLLARGEGAIIFISHLGNFEVCQALSENRPTLHLTVLQHTINAEKFNHFLKKNARESRVEFMQVTDLNITQAITLSERLSRGEFVAISADRVPIENPDRVLRKSFLGQPAYFPTGPFILARALQVPVVSVQCIKLKGRYQIHFQRLSSGGSSSKKKRDKLLNELMDKYIANLELHCLKAPWQWYNFFPFWQKL
ncbi:MAG: hypothetical protein GYB33_12495 [Gammaproteobacteria bacterium]|nr:hypothetical protein [Gammaproteobacteria bacterium]